MRSTRRASRSSGSVRGDAARSRRRARSSAAILADAGVTVVSGLAIGIDGAAHEGALDAGGLTVGVVATGLDVTYPRRHRDLYVRVREQGLVVSEHGYGVQPRPERFPPRNRIIAALADVVVVVEAGRRGGALITARCALDYGRDLFVLPGSRRNPVALGCNALIGDGAEVLLDPGDLLIALGRGGTLSRPLAPLRFGRTVRPRRDRGAPGPRWRPRHRRRPRAPHQARPRPARRGADPPGAGGSGPPAAGLVVADLSPRRHSGPTTSFSFRRNSRPFQTWN